MDLSLTDEQQELRTWAHDFAEREVRPVAARYDETEEQPWPVIRKAAETGLYGFDIYLQHTQDPTGQTLPMIMEEIFWGCAGIGLAIFGTGLPLAALAGGGTQEQLLEWAPKMFGTPEDPAVAAFAVTEPQAGSDVSSLRTRAERRGDQWVLNGTKVFITNGGVADVHLVVATVEPALGHRGQATFIVSSDDSGLRAGKKEHKLGIRASDTSEVILDDEAITRFRQSYRAEFGATADDPLYEAVSAGRKHAGMEHWLPFFHERLETLMDYLTEASICLDDQATAARLARWEFVHDAYESRAEGAAAKGRHDSVYKPLPPGELYLDDDAWQLAIAERRVLRF
ncbi:MAG: acyl-CoA dehydrogenase family protein, partial [Actinobacteria bacterium]|nr:acyl-CoA dehydrogenase family protein [Actinomycetota bacterium]